MECPLVFAELSLHLLRSSQRLLVPGGVDELDAYLFMFSWFLINELALCNVINERH